MATGRNYPSIFESVKDFIPLIDYHKKVNSTRFQRIIYKMDVKDNTRAEDLRQKGNQSFDTENYFQAIALYTKSIKLTPEDTVSLFESYVKRANILSTTSHYRECLHDLQRAEDVKCPKNSTFVEISNELKPRLEQEANIYVAEQIDPPDATPELKEKHEWIYCAANSVNLTENNGGHAIATRDIAPGEMIVSEKPAAVHVQAGSGCHHCLASCLNPIPCKSCTVAQYCGDVCKHVAWAKYHKYECPILLTMDSYNENICLPIKIALSIRNYDEEPSEEVERYDEFKEILNLPVNRSEFDNHSILRFAWLSGQIFHHVKTHTLWFEDVKSDRKEIIFRALLIKLFFIKSLYFYSFQRDIEYGDGEKVFDCKWEMAVPFQSVFMASCIPNVIVTMNDEKLITRTLFPIKKGEPLVRDPMCLFFSNTKKERLEILGSRYITCSCTACENNWPPIYEAQISNSSIYNGMLRLRRLVEVNKYNSVMLKVLFNILTDPVMANKEWEKPSREWQMYILTICSCYEYMDHKWTAIQYFRFNQGMDFGIQKLHHLY